MQTLANISSDLTPAFGVMLASVEGFFIFLIIAGISAVAQWLKKGKQDDWTKEQTPPTSPSRRTSAPPPISSAPKKSMNWEEELRRMLEGDNPTPRPAAPPVVPQQPKRVPVPPPIPSRPAQQAPPPTMALPKRFEEPRTYKAHCDHCGSHIEFAPNLLGESIVCPRCYKQTVLQPFRQTRVEEITHQKDLVTMKDAASAFLRGSNLEKRVAEHMESVSRTPVQMTGISDFKKRSAEVDQVVKIFRKPETARQAVIASMILAPPRALENY